MREIEFYEKHDNYADNIGELQKLLKEKDKEIERLNRDIAEMERQDEEFVDVFEKQIRHQVCDEIRDFIQKNESPSFSQSLCGYWFISAKKLFEFLDQIDQAKENIDED